MKLERLIIGTVITLLLIAGIVSWDSGKSYTPIISASATLNFPSTAAGTSSDLTVTLNGAAINDPVILGVDNASIVVNSCYTAWVSSANTVTVRFNNIELLAARDPASGTFKVTIIKN